MRATVVYLLVMTLISTATAYFLGSLREPGKLDNCILRSISSCLLVQPRELPALER